MQLASMIIPLMAADIFGVRVLGRLMGVVLTADGVAEALAPMLVASIRDRTASYAAGFAVLGQMPFRPPTAPVFEADLLGAGGAPLNWTTTWVNLARVFPRKLAQPQIEHRRSLQHVREPQIGDLKLFGLTAQFSRTPGAVESPPPRSARNPRSYRLFRLLVHLVHLSNESHCRTTCGMFLHWTGGISIRDSQSGGAFLFRPDGSLA
jgi:hypothetical protein